MRHARTLLERASLLPLDIVGFALGLRLAHAFHARTSGLQGFEPPPAFEQFGALVAVHVTVLLLVFFFQRMYHQPHDVPRIDLAGRLFRAVTLGAVVTFAVTSFLFPALQYSRRVTIYSWIATFAAVLALRLAHRAVWALLRRLGVGRPRVLILGAGSAGQDLVARIHRRPWLGYEIVGFLDDTPGRTQARGVPILGPTSLLARTVSEHEVDEVLIALPEASRSELVELVGQCDRDGTSIKILPDVFQMLAGEVQISTLDGLPLLTMHDLALRGWRRTLKRLIDILVSSTALVLTSPIILLLALLVKLESRGPVFFVQERMGLDMRSFPIIKIRSMRTDAEVASGPVWARRDDPRVTRLGRFMRRTNVDELPQLVNVLLGHMSIVGPRPERPEFVDEFRGAIPRYAERHRERGGITGWAQVNGLRGNTSIEERTKYDLYYIENWSILFDFKIMARTLLGSGRDPNAY